MQDIKIFWCACSVSSGLSNKPEKRKTIAVCMAIFDAERIL
jgi:hypothetical protein